MSRRKSIGKKEGTQMIGDVEKIGPETLQQMKSQVHDWTNSIHDRCDHLCNYIGTLEGLNSRLEGRTDRSLALAEVIYLFLCYYCIFSFIGRSYLLYIL